MKNDDDLTTLWQQQPVTNIDIEEVKSAFKKEQKKQRLFMLLDFLGVVPTAFIIYWKWDMFSTLASIMIVGVYLLCIPLLAYQLWLRRVVAFNNTQKTQGHLESLIKQMENNAKIAWLTKHSCWLAILFLVVFMGTMYLQGELSEGSNMKRLISLGITFGALGWAYQWANKRERKAKQRLAAFIDMRR